MSTTAEETSGDEEFNDRRLLRPGLTMQGMINSSSNHLIGMSDEDMFDTDIEENSN